jgi:hypothetical protein
MTELSDLDITQALTTETVETRTRDLGAPLLRRRLTARWQIDPETGRPFCLWSADE